MPLGVNRGAELGGHWMVSRPSTLFWERNNNCHRGNFMQLTFSWNRQTWTLLLSHTPLYSAFYLVFWCLWKSVQVWPLLLLFLTVSKRQPCFKCSVPLRLQSSMKWRDLQNKWYHLAPLSHSQQKPALFWAKADPDKLQILHIFQFDSNQHWNAESETPFLP